MKRIAVTGGAGQIAYSLLFRLAAGELFGKDQPIALHILEVPEVMNALEGVRMELEDCAFPLLKEIKIGSDPNVIFGDVELALLVGAKPRGPGMERKELLAENGKIFVGQGQALNRSAARNVRTFVVGNPCNTNCLIAMSNAPDLPRSSFHAMMRLDQNRAAALLASKSGTDVTQVSHMTIWGNHSSTQVPDFAHAKIGKKAVTEVIKDREWLEGTFIKSVQQRGAAIIAARGKSSAASAASALIDAVKAIYTPTPKDEWFSSAIYSEGNPYGIEEDLVFSFPCRSDGKGDCEIVKGVEWDAFLSKKIALTEAELKEERELVRAFVTPQVRSH